MSEPTLLVVGATRKRGRRPFYGAPLTRKIEVWVTEDQFHGLKSVASSEHKKQSAVIRDAVDAYVGDFRERRIFTRPPYTPE
jgi:hypothetical protein